VADALSFTAGTEYISFEEVLCLVSMSKLSVSEWWTVQRTSALTVIGGAALRRQRCVAWRWSSLSGLV
jgi:hypothetical protein